MSSLFVLLSNHVVVTEELKDREKKAMLTVPVLGASNSNHGSTSRTSGGSSGSGSSLIQEIKEGGIEGIHLTTRA